MKKVISLFLTVVLVLTVAVAAVPGAFAADLSGVMKQIATKETEDYYAYKGSIVSASFCTAVDTSNAATVIENVDGTDVTVDLIWDMSVAGDGSVTAWLEEDAEGNYELYIGADGKVKSGEYAGYIFEDFTKLVAVNNLENFDTSAAIDISGMFAGCTAMVNLDVTALDTQNVKYMQNVFSGCTSLENIVLGGSFKTDKVVSMYEMFMGCSAIAELDLSSFNTESLADATRMIAMVPDGIYDGEDYYKTALTTLRIDNWYFTENFTQMSGWLRGCTELSHVYIYSTKMDSFSSPGKDFAFKYVSDVTFHNNTNMTEEAKIWTELFDGIDGAVLVFDKPEHYTVTTNPSSIEMLAGQKLTVVATVLPRPENSVITWQSNNESVAKVKDGEVTAVAPGETTITVTNKTVDDGVTKTDSYDIPVKITAPSEDDYRTITFKKGDKMEYYLVSTDGGETFITVHDGASYKYLRGTKIIIKVYGSSLAYAFFVNGAEAESEYDDRIEITTNWNQTITVEPIDVPDGEETYNFFERILNAFRSFFDWLRNLFSR